MARAEIENLKARADRAEADNRRLLAELECAEAKLTGLLVEIRDATVTAAQVEAAAGAIATYLRPAHGRTLDRDRALASVAFRAAGYRIEETTS